MTQNTQLPDFAVITKWSQKKCRSQEKVDSSTVVYLKSHGNYVTIFNDDNIEFTTREKLNTVLELLSFKNLFRVHRRYAVNANKITSISKNAIVMESIEIPISKSYQTDILIDSFLK